MKVPLDASVLKSSLPISASCLPGKRTPRQAGEYLVEFQETISRQTQSHDPSLSYAVRRELAAISVVDVHGPALRGDRGWQKQREGV